MEWKWNCLRFSVNGMDEVKEEAFKYRDVTRLALAKIEILGGLSERDKKNAQDFIEMCRNYVKDGEFFISKGDFLKAFGCFSYAHAWLDAGVRAGILDGKGDSKLFTLKK